MSEESTESDRLRLAWTSARRRARVTAGAWRYLRVQVQRQREEVRRQDEFAGWLWREMSKRRQERDRYRLAWLSARRRARREIALAREAVELLQEENAQLRARLT
ncbi:hypothetical protein ADL27_38500 [Streptomyces sp. NRRL F-6602]|nr:hypothetical protein ADL27_38500 [Streptomyces sp. NRRL F-6602]